MPNTKRNKLIKPAIHIGFWFVSMLLTLLLFYYNENRVHFDLVILSKAFITNVGFALAVYVNLWVLIPKFLKRKNYIFYVFWLIVLLSFSSLFIHFLLIFPLRNILDVGIRFSSFDVNLHAAFFSATLIYVVTTSFLKFIKDWLTMQDLNLKLAKIEQQKLEAELKTLKGQLNPHFLFNSLNNIYSLALTNSEKVPGLLLQLADLMRHIIYESRANFIELDKEIEFVNNFIALQKIRAADDVDIQITTLGAIPNGKIAPLIFEPFIDNAFKHGLPGTEGNDFIKINFDFKSDNWITFSIKNNYEPVPNKNNRNSGIGLENVKQRLKHLYASSDYQLNIEHQNRIHSVKLHLKLK
ncbi:Histidine kinase [Mariniphaga anaerophila]|uniref:Histidine kinase n=1 Tax=Mariniphaga anaerophila TaxID=1484053 RepID=A0A1M5DA23_9BACT|nr:histidine kinase [Mariniphaga anaerophila]SHF63787.1 Histidine kinase [Mariniphaga anaerophila]